MNSSLGYRGYTIYKDSLTSQDIYSLRKELTVKPFVNSSYGGVSVPFPVYCESKNKVYDKKDIFCSVTTRSTQFVKKC